jgi:hypothetical protein
LLHLRSTRESVAFRLSMDRRAEDVLGLPVSGGEKARARGVTKWGSIHL